MLTNHSRSRMRDRSSVESAFRPTQLPSCVLWLRADLGITLNAGNVSAWANQGSAAGSASQGTGTSQPTYTTTGFGATSQPYLSFDATSDYLDLTTVGSLGTAYTFVFAVRYRSYTASNCIASVVNSGLADYNNATTAILGHVNAGTGLEHYVNGARGVATRPTANTAAIVSMVQNATVSDVYVNGTVGTQVGNTGALNAAMIRFGARSIPGVSNYSRIDLAEAIGFGRALSAAELLNLHRKLGAFYGITVA